MKTIRRWAILAGVTASAACAPQAWEYVDDVPRVDAGRRDARADARADVPGDRSTPNDLPTSDVTAPEDRPTEAIDVAAADVSVAPDIPVVDVPAVDRAPVCMDTDLDGISDELEGAPDVHTSGVSFAPPDFLNVDSDDDGVMDADEARRVYPGFPALALPPLLCGDPPDDCDADGIGNQQDRDSDNDGLTDREEVAVHHTNPCSPDSDSDGVVDLIEVAAMSSPTDPMRRPPEGSLYVTLPYRDRRGPQTREFSFRTRIRNADVMFLVDTTGSMGSTISAVRSTLSTQIVPGIVAAFGPGADVRYGMSDHRDFAEGGPSGSDYALQVLQRLDPNPALS